MSSNSLFYQCIPYEPFTINHPVYMTYITNSFDPSFNTLAFKKEILNQ